MKICPCIGWNTPPPRAMGRLCAYPISHFVGILPVFLQNAPQNTKYPLYTFCISLKFHICEKINNEILLMLCKNATPGAKCCKMKKMMWNAKKVSWNTPPIYLSHFILSCKKCTTNLTEPLKLDSEHDNVAHIIEYDISIHIHLVLLKHQNNPGVDIHHF